MRTGKVKHGAKLLAAVVGSFAFLGVFGYGFYLTLGWRLPPIIVAIGSVMVFLLGFGVAIGAPFLVGKNASWGVRYRMFRFYNWLFQKSFGRGQLVNREHAGVELCASRFDSDHGGEQVKLDGEWRDFEDIADRMQYLRKGGAFGIIDEASTLIIDPVDATIGAKRGEVLESGEGIIDFEEPFGECVREHVILPEEPPAVDLREATHLKGGNADPTDAEATEEYEKKAWFDHQNVPVMDAMVMAGLFAATLFVIWLAFSFADSQGGGGGGASSGIVSGMLLPMWRWRA